MIISYQVFIWIPLLLVACNSTTEKSNRKIVNCDDIVEVNGVWQLNNMPYTGNCQSFENGKITTYSEFKEGQVHGVIKQYYPNGNLEEVVEYKNGKANGKVMYFFENGQLSQVGKVKDNSKEGIWTRFYPNGKTQDIENWKNNQMQDSIFSYYSNGKMHSKGIYVNGKEDGRWIMYDSATGQIDGYLIYNKGKVVGTEPK